MKNHLLCFLKHSETYWALSLGCVAAQAALEPCLEEWVLWGGVGEGGDLFHPTAVVERLGGTPQFGAEWAGTEPALLLH